MIENAAHNHMAVVVIVGVDLGPVFLWRQGLGERVAAGGNLREHSLFPGQTLQLPDAETRKQAHADKGAGQQKEMAVQKTHFFNRPSAALL